MSCFARTHLITPLIFIAMSVAGALAQGAEFSTPEANYVWENVDVTDLHGWNHRGVSIQWVGGGEALLISRADGATKTVQPDQILHVYDASGRDITEEVAGARVLGTQVPWPTNSETTSGSGGSEIGGSYAPPSDFDGRGATLAELTAEELFDFALDVGLGYGSTSGNWFEGLDGGVHYQVGARIMINPRSFFHFIYRHQDLGSVTMVDGWDMSEFNIDFAVDEFQFLFGRHGATVRNKPVRSTGYGEFGLSFMSHRVEASGLHSGDLTETKLGLVLQAGVLVMLDRQWALDVSGGVTWKMGMSDDEGTGMLWGARVALVFLTGGPADKQENQ